MVNENVLLGFQVCPVQIFGIDLKLVLLLLGELGQQTILCL